MSDFRIRPNLRTLFLLAVALIGLTVSTSSHFRRARTRTLEVIAHVERLGGYSEWGFDAEKGQFHQTAIPDSLRQVLPDTFNQRPNYVYLAGSSFSDADDHWLAHFYKLEGLNLSSTNVSDEGMAALSTITTLEELQLFDTRISDRGLADLQQLDGLKVLYLGGTQVTEAGISDFEKAVPNCRIEIDGW